MKISARSLLLLITVVGVLLSCGNAQGAFFTVDDTNPNGTITVRFGDFEHGFCVNYFIAGPQPASTCTQNTGAIGQGATVTINPANGPITFNGSWVALGPGPGGAITGLQTLYLVDPGTNHVRDSIAVQYSLEGTYATIVTGSFSSDVPSDLGSVPPGGTTIQVTGAQQDVTPALGIPQNLSVGVTAKLVTVGPTLGGTGTSANPSGGISATVNQTTTQAVNTSTGNTFITFSDLVVPGKGLRFTFIRSYNDQDPYIGPLLRGWTHSYNILLTADPTSRAVTIKEADGHQNVFQPGSTPGTYTAPTGVYDVLVNTGLNTYTLTRANQTVLAFGPVSLTPLILRLLSIVDKNSNAQTLSYDLVGNLKTFTDVGGGTFTFAYDDSNHLLSVHDTALNRTYSYANDGANLTTYTDASGQVGHYSYSNNLLTVATDPRTNTAVNNTFDPQGRILQTSHAVGAMTCTTTYVYDDVNHITTITDPLGDITKHYYDTAKRLIKIVNALGLTTTFTYDSSNNLTSITNPLGRTTTYSYDSRGNRLSATAPLGDQTKFSYDLKNNVVVETDANGNSTKFGYDPKGNLTSVTDALGGVTTYTYDARGNKLTFQNAKGNTTIYTYDSSNHVLTAVDPALKTTTSAYDAGGRLASQIEPVGNSKTLAYDVLGRLISVNYAAGTSSLASVGLIAYGYDANGNRTSMSDSTGTTSYVYDAVNRLTSVTFPGNRQVTYTYDCNGNRTSLSYAGKVVNYAYDRLNRLTSVADGTNVTNYTYDAADSLLKIAYPNGAGVGYTYDGANRLTQVRNMYTGGPGKSISSFTYVLDKVGNRIQVTDGDGTVSAFTYDKVYRLLTTTVNQRPAAYSYDAVGNRLTQNAPGVSIGYTYDAADKLMSAGSATFVYDFNGNQVSQNSGGISFHYGFDAADRLISVSGGTGPSSRFTYDGDGNRVSQTAGAGAYSYLNDVATGFTTVLDENGPDGHIQYVRGKGLVSADSPSFTHYYQYDAQTTAVGLTDTKGHVVKVYTYGVWGELQGSIPPPQVGTQNKFGYTGEALDPGTGLYYLRARYYDPNLGRFIGKDPFAGFDRAPQTLNRFVYVRNNPATLTDRTGLCALDPDLDPYLDPDLFPCPTPGPP